MRRVEFSVHLCKVSLPWGKFEKERAREGKLSFHLVMGFAHNGFHSRWSGGSFHLSLSLSLSLSLCTILSLSPAPSLSHSLSLSPSAYLSIFTEHSIFLQDFTSLSFSSTISSSLSKYQVRTPSFFLNLSISLSSFSSTLSLSLSLFSTHTLFLFLLGTLSLPS